MNRQPSSSTHASITLLPLRERPESIPRLCILLAQTWPAWYGPEGPGTVRDDLAAYADGEALPFGLVAFLNNQVCGFAALKTEGIDGYDHLGPWLGSACVRANLRRQGIGTQLIDALERQARRLGYPRLYAGTHAASLLQHNGWQLLGQASQQGERLQVFEKSL